MGRTKDRGHLLIGLDLDNTIICYGDLFYQVALERGWIEDACKRDKSSVRKVLQQQKRNDLWTELQGLVYGHHLHKALPYPGVAEFLAHCSKANVPAWIVSHKTRFAAAGSPYDLHASAYRWLRSSGLIDGKDSGVSAERIEFCETRTDKLETIGRIGFTHFIDDLPEVFLDVDFPARVERILFDPEDVSEALPGCRRVHSWQEIETMIFDAG